MIPSWHQMQSLMCWPWCMYKDATGPQGPPHNALLHQYLQIMRKLNEKLKNIVGMEKLKEELVQLASNRMADLKREELGLVVKMNVMPN